MLLKSEIAQYLSYMLKLNDHNREVLAISSPFFSDKLHETHIRIGDASIQASESAHNFGVIFGSSLEMSNHVKTVCRVSFMQLRLLRCIKDNLTQDLLEKVTHAFISSHLAYGNALLYGLPRLNVSKLQHIQNVAEIIKLVPCGKEI